MVKDKKGYSVKTADKAEEVSAEEGGYMALALQSYGLKVETTNAYIKQIRSVMDDLKSGKLKTEEECVAAFRERVGSGLASELYYDDLEINSMAAWKTFLAEQEAKLEKQALEEQAKIGEQASAQGKHLEGTFADAKMHALSEENNLTTFGDGDDKLAELGRMQLAGERDVVNAAALPADMSNGPMFNLNLNDDDPLIVDGVVSKYEAYQGESAFHSGSFTDAPVTNDFKLDPSAFKLPEPDANGMVTTYDRWGNMTISGQDTSFVSGSGPSHDQLVQLGLATQSKQANSQLEMSKEDSDLAYKTAVDAIAVMHQELAQLNTLVEAGDLKAAEAERLHRQALENLAMAKVNLQAIEGSNFGSIQLAISDSEAYIRTVEESLCENDELRAVVDAHWASLKTSIAAIDTDIKNYRPEVLKVPMPELNTLDPGIDITNKTYNKLAMSVSFPLWAFINLKGSVSAEASVSTTLAGENAGDVWTGAKIAAALGVEADLKLFKLGLEISGFFDTSSKGIVPLNEVAENGVEELGRWAYAVYWDIAGLVQRMDMPIDEALEETKKIYNTFDAQTLGEEAGNARTQKAAAAAKASLMMTRLSLAAGIENAVANGEAEIEDMDPADMVGNFLPLEDMFTRIDELAQVDADERSEHIAGQITGIEQQFQTEHAAVNNQIDPEDSAKNNPDVKFTAGVAFRGYASLGFKKNKIEAGYKKTWSITDGSDETFKTGYKVQDEYYLKGSVAALKVDGEIKAKPKNEGAGGTIDLSIGFPIAGSDTDASELVERTPTLFDDMFTGGVLTMVDFGKKFFSDQTMNSWGVGALLDIKETKKTKMKIAVTLSMDKMLPPKFKAVDKVSVSVTSTRTIGSDMASLSYEKGNTLTADFKKFNEGNKDKGPSYTKQ